MRSSGLVLAVFLALALAGCPVVEPNVDGANARKPVPDAPAAPAGPHVLRRATLACTMDLPPGWKMNGGLMPDHVIEAFTDDLRARVTARQVPEATVTEGVAAAHKRITAQWGGQPGFALVREQALGTGRLLVHSWAPHHADSATEVRLTAVIVVAASVLEANVVLPPGTPEEPITAALASIRCQPKPP